MIEDAKWRWRKASTLVKLLTLAPNHRLHRKQILDFAWPDLAPPQDANSYHQKLHLARHILYSIEAGKTRWLRLDEDLLVLALDDALWIDVQAFEEAATVACQRSKTGVRDALLGSTCRLQLFLDLTGFCHCLPMVMTSNSPALTKATTEHFKRQPEIQSTQTSHPAWFYI